VVVTLVFEEFDSTLPIAIYIALGAITGIVATVLLPEPGRRAVEKEFTSAVEEEIPETARASRGKLAVTN
jgi:hypothetical protein